MDNDTTNVNRAEKRTLTLVDRSAKQMKLLRTFKPQTIYALFRTNRQ